MDQKGSKEYGPMTGKWGHLAQHGLGEPKGRFTSLQYDSDMCNIWRILH